MSTDTAVTKIKLTSNDGVTMEVGPYSPPYLAPQTWNTVLTVTIDRQVAEKSILIKHMMEDLGDGALDCAVPIPNVSTPFRDPIRADRVQV